MTDIKILNLKIGISVDLSSCESCYWSNGCYINVRIGKEKQIHCNTIFYTILGKFFIEVILWCKYCLWKKKTILFTNDDTKSTRLSLPK